jgi:hypothetical protein
MKITNVTVGKSVQVCQYGQPEYWHKITVTAELDDIETEEEAIDELFKVVTEAHDKYSKSFIEPDTSFGGAVKKESIEDLKKELNAGHK